MNVLSGPGLGALCALGSALALTISMTYPLMATLFAAGFLGAPLSARVLVSSVLTPGGLAMIVTTRGGGSSHDRRQWWLAFGCAIVASLSWALSAVMLKAPLPTPTSRR